MTRRCMLGLPFGLGLAAAKRLAAAEVGSLEYRDKLLRFNDAYCIFYRDYFGCGPNATRLSECTLGSGHTNYDAYLKASRLVKDVFPAAFQAAKLLIFDKLE